jgi:hypothetical protein
VGYSNKRLGKIDEKGWSFQISTNGYGLLTMCDVGQYFLKLPLNFYRAFEVFKGTVSPD